MTAGRQAGTTTVAGPSAVRKGVTRMATTVCLLIRSAAEADHGESAQWIRELETMLEVRRVYRVLGQHDLQVELEAWADPLHVASTILQNRFVEHLVISSSPHRPGTQAPRDMSVARISDWPAATDPA